MRILPALFCLLFLLIFPIHALAAIELTASIKDSDGETITLEVSITGTSNSYYLQGLFTEPGKTNYFGYTQNHQDNWFLVDATPSEDYITSNFYKTEPINDSWTADLKIKNDTESKNYKGSGEYELKVRRYTGNSKSHTGDEVVVTTSLNYSLPSPENSPDPSPSPSQESTPTLTPTPESTLASTSYRIATTPTPEGDIAGTSDSAEINLPTFVIDPSPSPEPEDEEKKSKTPLALAGAGLTFTAAGGAYFYQQKKKKPKINIPN